MKKNYQTPQVEVIEIELESMLCQSGVEDLDAGDILGITKLYDDPRYLL